MYYSETSLSTTAVFKNNNIINKIPGYYFHYEFIDNFLIFAQILLIVITLHAKAYHSVLSQSFVLKSLVVLTWAFLLIGRL